MVKIGPGSTKLRRVEFWLAPEEWLVAYNTVARLCYMWLWQPRLLLRRRRRLLLSCCCYYY